MVKLSFFLTFYLITFSTEAQSRMVSHMEIDNIGQYFESQNDLNEKRACEEFQPTEKQLIQFFNSAKESEESNGLLHDYYSPCYSEGKIKFSDGSTGQWILQSSGLAYVTFSDNNTTYFFYKDNNWYDPFECSYGSDDEAEC
ncbi:hypothetical protein [Erwinia oleae]|uniref:hypothetical protein n=1 Tax=Erwinia oleae TaxID=796334 RepID=UPI00055219B1|nr:hypothetical protein [Erwinia oleae]